MRSWQKRKPPRTHVLHELNEIHSLLRWCAYSRRSRTLFAQKPMCRLSPISRISGGNVLGTLAEPYFVHAWIANSPEHPTRDSVAQRVVAHVTFSELGHGNDLLTMAARWSHTPEPALVGGAVREIHNEIDMQPNGLAYPIDIAMKHLEDEECYAHNNESVTYEMWRHPQRALKPGKYRVRVDLRGVGANKTFWFELHNPGRNFPPSIIALEDVAQLSPITPNAPATP